MEWVLLCFFMLIMQHWITSSSPSSALTVSSSSLVWNENFSQSPTAKLLLTCSTHTCLPLAPRPAVHRSASHLLTSFPSRVCPTARPDGGLRSQRKHAAANPTWRRRRQTSGALTLLLPSAIAPAWPDLRAPLRVFSRCGCHGDAQCCCCCRCWWERWACSAHTLRGLKIERGPELPPCLNIDLYLMRDGLMSQFSFHF